MTEGKVMTARQEALKRYREKNAKRERLPGVMLTEDEAALLDEMAAEYGSKKAAIIAGLERLKEMKKHID